MIALAKDFEWALPKTALASVLGISRSSLYRENDVDRDADLRDAIYALTMDWPRYGYRKVTHDLRRQGWSVNEKRVRRIMLAEGLLCRRRVGRGLKYRKTAVPSFPNLAHPLKPDAVNQLWVAVLHTYASSALSFRSDRSRCIQPTIYWMSTCDPLSSDAYT